MNSLIVAFNANALNQGKLINMTLEWTDDNMPFAIDFIACYKQKYYMQFDDRNDVSPCIDLHSLTFRLSDSMNRNKRKINTTTASPDSHTLSPFSCRWKFKSRFSSHISSAHLNTYDEWWHHHYHYLELFHFITLMNYVRHFAIIFSMRFNPACNITTGTVNIILWANNIHRWHRMWCLW